MIASLRGEIQASGTGWLVVEVGGVGMRVEVPERRVAHAHVGSSVFLHTHLVVREDSLTLFGFASVEELEVFGLLLGVTGVGPRSALGALTALTPAQIARAVQAEDDRVFRQISGVGPKTAKLIALSLAGKLVPQRYLGSGSTDETEVGNTDVSDTHADTGAVISATVLQALVNLGYQESHAEQAVSDAIHAGATVEQSALLRATLVLLQAPRQQNSSRSGGAR